MDIGNRINQLRKLAGMTQEQLAEKLNVSRQTVSKWEAGTTLPDLESIIKIVKIFHVSLDDLLLEGDNSSADDTEKITLQDLIKINNHNRKMILLLVSGLILIMVAFLNYAYIRALRYYFSSMDYTLYRYIVVKEYVNSPVNDKELMLLSMIMGGIGILLCVCYIILSSKYRRGKRKNKQKDK